MSREVMEKGLIITNFNRERTQIMEGVDCWCQRMRNRRGQDIQSHHPRVFRELSLAGMKQKKRSQKRSDQKKSKTWRAKKSSQSEVF